MPPAPKQLKRAVPGLCQSTGCLDTGQKEPYNEVVSGCSDDVKLALIGTGTHPFPFQTRPFSSFLPIDICLTTAQEDR